jgi:hypothetical protein
MKNARPLLAAALALLLGAAPALHAQSGAALDLARTLVARSGLAEQLKSYPKQVDEEIAQARGKLPGEVLVALREAAKLSYDAADLQRDIEHTLAADMPAADMREAIAWLETAAGRRITRAEEESSASMTPGNLQAYAESLRRAPPSARRAGQLAGLIEATNAVAQSVHLMESIALGIAVGMDAVQPEQNRVGLAALRERLEAAMPREQMREAMGAGLPLMYGYLYRKVSDADLAAYLEFNRSPVGTRYNDAVMKAFTDALTRASIGMGPLIQQGLRKKAA